MITPTLKSCCVVKNIHYGVPGHQLLRFLPRLPLCAGRHTVASAPFLPTPERAGETRSAPRLFAVCSSVFPLKTVVLHVVHAERGDGIAGSHWRGALRHTRSLRGDHCGLGMKACRVLCFKLSPHGFLEPRMHASVSEFWEPDFARWTGVLSFLNQPMTRSRSPTLTQRWCLFSLIVSFCGEPGLTAASSASPFFTCT